MLTAAMHTLSRYLAATSKSEMKHTEGKQISGATVTKNLSPRQRGARDLYTPGSLTIKAQLPRMELYNIRGIILCLLPCDNFSMPLALAGTKSTVPVHEIVHSAPSKQQRLLATNDQAEMLEIEGCHRNKQTNTHSVNACS